METTLEMLFILNCEVNFLCFLVNVWGEVVEDLELLGVGQVLHITSLHTKVGNQVTIIIIKKLQLGDHAAGVRRDITWMQGFEDKRN